MNDEEQKPEFYWFQTTNNPYARRIQTVLDEAERHGVPSFRIHDMLRELARPFHPNPPRSRLNTLIAHIRLRLFGPS